MNKLGFSIIWTVLATLGAGFMTLGPEYQNQGYLFKVMTALFPFFGLPFICDSLRRLRRFRSVRRETIAKETVYIWTELDGSTKSSDLDPRIEWDKEDRNFADP